MKTNVTRFLISREKTLKQAMKQLEETEERILFVVDRDPHLYGSLTDGDIRRWVLADRSLDEPVGRACNRAPLLVPPSYDVARVKQTMLDNNIASVPVVNDSGEIVELLFWTDLFQEESERRPATLSVPVVIMAGGKGTRLDPFTRILPKPLIPIGDKTVIEIVIESFLRHGVSSFYVSVNSKAKIIKSYFEELHPSYSITYLEEDEPRGTAGALRQLVGKVSGPLILTNCDIIVKLDYDELVQHHRAKGYDLTLVTCMKSYRIPYGICKIENGGTLAQIHEKPEYDFLVNTGFYVVESRTLSLIPEEREFHTTELIEKVQDGGGRIGVYPVGESSWLDTGEWAEYKRALERFRI